MKIKIIEPWWGAWSKFGWGEKIPGIGFKANLVDTLAKMHEKITVTIGMDKTEYEIAAVTIQNLAKKYKSTYLARFGTPLYVIPQNALKKIKPL